MYSGRLGAGLARLDLGDKAVAAVVFKAAIRGKSAVGIGGGRKVRRVGKAGHGDEAAGGVNRDAVPLVIVFPPRKPGVNQRGGAALGGVDDAQAGVVEPPPISSDGVGVTGKSAEAIIPLT